MMMMMIIIMIIIIINRCFCWIEYLESMNVKICYLKRKDNILSYFINKDILEGEKLHINFSELNIDNFTTYQPRPRAIIKNINLFFAFLL